MSLADTLARLRARLTGESGPVGPSAAPTEEDAGHDPRTVASRATGGVHDHLSADRGSTTGTGKTDANVGQIAGDDLGYAEETGAERRATHDGGTS